MGMDQYILAAGENERHCSETAIYYWRKNDEVNDWMTRLERRKNRWNLFYWLGFLRSGLVSRYRGCGDVFYPQVFLTIQDIEDFEQRFDDPEFAKRAGAAIRAGKTIYYCADW